MAWDTPDLYHQPEKFGLEPFCSLDEPGMSYSFNMFQVWRHTETNELYWAQDSGCSCPSPFQDFTSLEHATKLDKLDLPNFVAAVNEFAEPFLLGEKQILIAKVAQHLW